jgi:hypothetical protein
MVLTSWIGHRDDQSTEHDPLIGTATALRHGGGLTTELRAAGATVMH